MKKSAQVNKGFTLVELLVVIAIIAILAAVVVLIINPLELTRRGRDAARLTDLANLQNAINVAAQESVATGTDVLCVGGLTLGTPATHCSGETNAAAAADRVTDGTGWVKVKLDAAGASVTISTLPVDPITPNTDDFHYTYCSDGTAWEIDANLESDQQASKMTDDGGDEVTHYEVGSNLTLINPTSACTF